MRVLHYIDENNLSWARPFVQLLCELRKLGCENIVICKPGGTFSNLLRDSNFEVHEYKPLISALPEIAQGFHKIVKDIKPDIIHTRLSSAANIAGFHGKKLHIPVLATIDKFPKRKYYENVTHILPCSKAVKKFMNEQGIEESKMTVLENAVDFEFYARNLKVRDDIRKSENLNDKIIFLGMGRFVDWKGFDDLLTGFSEFLKTQSQPEKYFLFLAGDGEEKNNLITLSESLRISEQVKFLGFVQDVRPILWASDIYIHPSWGDEAFGLSLLEAMSSGLACIASESGGMIEILNNDSGLLFKRRNIESLVDKIKECILKRSVLSVKAMLRAQDFDTKNIARKTLELYEFFKNAK